jgi:hypothetical protein
MPVTLPVVAALDSISIPSHCPVSWEEMEGNDHSRFCTNCQHHVHDVSELTTEEALSLVRGSDNPPCLRIYRRTDGRVLTVDCTTSRDRVWKWIRRRSPWVASVFAVIFLSGCRTATQGMILEPHADAIAVVPDEGQPPKSPPQ